MMVNTKSFAIGGLALVAVLLLGAGVAYQFVGSGAAPEARTPGGPTTARRLNEAQYRRSIDMIFGEGIEVPGRFDPAYREGGLLAIGDAKVSVTPVSIEQHRLRAREISAAVLSEERRQNVMNCAPSSSSAFDRACAEQFLSHYGTLLYRRPLSDAELEEVLSLTREGVDKTGSFYHGLEAGLARLLMSPYFLFRVEDSEADPHNEGMQRLNPYSLASRISFLLWDSPPDAELLAVAQDGSIYDSRVLEQQADRLIASPQFEDGVRAFFSDMLGYEQFDGLAKDQVRYPRFTTQLADDALEQSLRSIVHHLVEEGGDYRDLFTSRHTFMNRRMAALYSVPVYAEPDGPGSWVPYTFSADDKRAGILTWAAFLMLDPTHEGATSPTIRGQMVREKFLCQKIPDPPPDAAADFGNIDLTVLKTARERLTIHMEQPACRGCHALTDPIGLSMENYDTIGAFRVHENGAKIDPTGEMDGVQFSDLLELGEILRESPAIPFCLVSRVFEYAVGRPSLARDRDWLDERIDRFARSGYRIKSLMRDLALNQGLQAVMEASVPASGTTLALQ